MNKTFKVAVIIGSLRKGSYCRMTAKAMMALAPESLDMSIVEIGDLTMYNQDLDAEPPKAWADFREKVAGFDAVLFVTPEYNRSSPAAIKNAIDIGSRPYGHSVWSGKPAAVISVSPGALGGFGANHHLRQSLVFLNMPTMQQPEAYIGGISKLLDENGAIVEEGTEKFFGSIITAFAAWIEKNVA
jgi:chromate reductase